MQINIEINDQDRQHIAVGLSRLLAYSYTLYLKIHYFHWNVTGSMFATLHQLFKQHYTEFALAVDEIKKRIRALGYPTPGSYSQFAKLASVSEETAQPGATDMIRQLVDDQEAVTRTAQQVIEVANNANDEPTADSLTQRMQIHEKKCLDAALIVGKLMSYP